MIDMKVTKEEDTDHSVAFRERHVVGYRVEHLRQLRVLFADQRPLIFAVVTLHSITGYNSSWTIKYP